MKKRLQRVCDKTCTVRGALRFKIKERRENRRKKRAALPADAGRGEV